VFLSIVVLLVVLAFLLGWVLAFRFRKPVPPPPPPAPSPAYSIPDAFSEQDLPSALNVRLIGVPANGVPAHSASAPPSQVIWVDGVNEVLVHLDSTKVRILDGMLLVSVDLETDQTGRTPLVCTFALGTTGDQAGLVATAEEFPRGNGSLAATWGRQFQQAVWSSILSLANDHANERNQAPRGIFASAGKLSLNAGSPIVVGPATASPA
jgi:hypothetical protein